MDKDDGRTLKRGAGKLSGKVIRMKKRLVTLREVVNERGEQLEDLEREHVKLRKELMMFEIMVAVYCAVSAAVLMIIVLT